MGIPFLVSDTQCGIESVQSELNWVWVLFLILLSSVHHSLKIILAGGLLFLCAQDGRQSAGGFLISAFLSAFSLCQYSCPSPSGRMLLQGDSLFQPHSLASTLHWTLEIPQYVLILVSDYQTLFCIQDRSCAGVFCLFLSDSATLAEKL